MGNFMTGFMQGYDFVDRNKRLNRAERIQDKDRLLTRERQTIQDQRANETWARQQQQWADADKAKQMQGAAYLVDDQDFMNKVLSGDQAAQDTLLQTAGNDPRIKSFLSNLSTKEGLDSASQDINTLEAGFSGKASKAQVIEAANRVLKPFLDYGDGGKNKRINDIFPSQDGQGFHLDLAMEDEKGNTIFKPMTGPNRSASDNEVKTVPAAKMAQAIGMIKAYINAQRVALGDTGPLTSAAKTFTLSPGQTVYNGEGQPIVSAPQDPMKGLSADYKTFLQANQLPNSPDSYKQFEQHQVDIAQQKQNAGFGVAIDGIPSQIHGDELLKVLPNTVASQVKALSEGRMAFPAGFALKSPYWQKMITLVSQYDPSFDAVNYQARNATRKDFTQGKSADNITALNTAIAHLGTLAENFNKMNNSRFPLYNKVANAAGNALGNEAIQKNYAAVGANAEAVAHELAKVFRTTGMSEAEIRAWKEKISENASPAQQAGIIQEAISLMEGRLNALTERYNQGMGTTKEPLQLLTLRSQNTIKKLLRVTGGVQQDSIPDQSAGAQRTIQEGQTATNPQTGERIIWRSGQWQPLQ